MFKVPWTRQNHLEDPKQRVHEIFFNYCSSRLEQVCLHQNDQSRDVALPHPVVLLQERLQHHLHQVQVSGSCNTKPPEDQIKHRFSN